MKRFLEKNNLMKIILLLFSEIICLSITRFSINLSENTYNISLNIVQGLYFIPILIVSLYTFLTSKSKKNIIIFSTIFLIFYSILLRLFIKQIASLFAVSLGVINFVEYSSKIYFICLPLIGFRIYHLKNTRRIYYILVSRIVLFFILSLLLNYFFNLKGILYAIPLHEFIYFIIIFIKRNRG